LTIHIDLDNLAAQTFSSTVCIVGGGIAGLTLATRLAAQNITVHLLEAGGLELEDRSQALYATEQPLEHYHGADEGRFRAFGGSSIRWGAQLLPFTDDIFSPPPGSPSRSWPIAEADLLPYYEDIQKMFGTDLLPFGASLLTALGHPVVPFSSGVQLRFSKWAPFSKRNLAKTLGKDALEDPSMTVFTHANAACFEGTGDSIQSVKVLNYAGDTFTFTARHFILAAGTIESSRLLLSSPGVPNPHDQLGRFFHDHLSFHAGEFISSGREAICQKLGPFFVEGTLHTCKLEASAEMRSREGLYAAMAHVVVMEPEDSGPSAIRNLLRSLQAGRIKQAVAVNLLPMLRGVADVARLLLYARFKRRRAISAGARLLLNVDVEQFPDPDNRIRLSEKRDALGLPVAIVQWRINQAEQDSAMRFASLIRTELTALGIAPSIWDESLQGKTAPSLVDTYHAMGGLCMGVDPAQSVVGPDLKVHGVTNLYVASCAVFPSGASSNPTFTLLALAMRLAEQLAVELGPV
jgi:choline dehydrogenase-like flavoprotein